MKLSDEEKHPIAAGLIALAAVAGALGLIAGIVTLVATTVFGVGGGGGSAGTASAGSSLYLPTPSPTETKKGPLITLAPVPGEDESSATSSSTPSPSASGQEKDKEKKEITLTASKPTAGSMERVDLSGVYPKGEGAVLQVQRKDGGAWVDFPVTAGVSGGQFSTYIQTGRAGAQKWRVRDTDTGTVSNVVTVTIG